LLCISKAIFEKLTLATREFIVEPARSEFIPAPAQENNPSFKSPTLPIADNRKTGYLEYSPSRIWNTRDSSFWQWRRVSEWWRDYRQDDFINEKRHIIL
jgi:endo-beta-N-acetylglucosaminidase D